MKMKTPQIKIMKFSKSNIERKFKALNAFIKKE